MSQQVSRTISLGCFCAFSSSPSRKEKHRKISYRLARVYPLVFRLILPILISYAARKLRQTGSETLPSVTFSFRLLASSSSRSRSGWARIARIVSAPFAMRSCTANYSNSVLSKNRVYVFLIFFLVTLIRFLSLFLSLW